MLGATFFSPPIQLQYAVTPWPEQEAEKYSTANRGIKIGRKAMLILGMVK